MFEHFSYDDMLYIYRGLKALIESGCGYGFHNADMGHPAYVAGADGQDSSNFGDSPESNRLFQMLSELSTRLKNEGIENHQFVWWYDFTEWQKFCEFALNIHRERGGL